MPSADPPQISDQTIVLFPLTVDTDLSLMAQSLLCRECGIRLCSIQVEARPDTHETCLWVTLVAATYGHALRTLILGLPAAQFGAVKTVRTDVVSFAQAA